MAEDKKIEERSVRVPNLAKKTHAKQGGKKYY